MNLTDRIAAITNHANVIAWVDTLDRVPFHVALSSIRPSN